MESKELQTMNDFAMSAVGQQIKMFEMQQRMAKMYSTSTIVPDTYKNNLGNCVIALDMAQRMKVNPLMVMQNLYIVHGNPAFSSKFLISCINASGRFSPLRYVFTGERGKDDWGCKVVAYEIGDKEKQHPLEGANITIGLAKSEGWFNKSGSKWKTMPEQMLRYRAAAFWQRAYCPEISMGFISAEEAREIEDVDYEDITPKTTHRNKLAEMAATRMGIETEATLDEQAQEQATDELQAQDNEVQQDTLFGNGTAE